MKKTKKKHRTRFKFICPIFQDEIFLFIGEKEKAEQFCGGLNLTTNHRGKVVEMFNSDETRTGFLVWVDCFKNYHTMVHETLHLTGLIFKFHGVPFTADNEEMIAYYQNYWVRKFWHKMSKFIDKKENK